jgi:two-component system, OmpR family, response regulator
MNGCKTGYREADIVRILLVEDEVKMARAIRRGLEQETYSVDVCAEGDDALRRSLDNEYDAIVLDVMLPGRDGFSVCREMRMHGRWAPILMLTARDAVEDRIHGLDAGADDYLVKPFAFGELLARVRAMVRRGTPERPATLHVDDVVLDPATHVVRRGDEPIELTPKEFALLEFLMRHPDEVLSRTRILEHVWDMNHDGFSNVVDVYVGYLRRKLDVAVDRTFIRTVRGVGYQVGGA